VYMHGTGLFINWRHPIHRLALSCFQSCIPYMSRDKSLNHAKHVHIISYKSRTARKTNYNTIIEMS